MARPVGGIHVLFLPRQVRIDIPISAKPLFFKKKRVEFDDRIGLLIKLSAAILGDLAISAVRRSDLKDRLLTINKLFTSLFWGASILSVDC